MVKRLSWDELFGLVGGFKWRIVNKDQAIVKTLVVIAAVLGGAWLLQSLLTKPSAADREAAVYEHLQDTKSSPAAMCQQAKIVEQAYVREGVDAKAQSWTTIREMACLSADTCRYVEGACAR